MKWAVRLVIGAILLSQTVTASADEKALFKTLEKVQVCAENSNSSRKECSDLYVQAMAEKKSVEGEKKFSGDCNLELNEYLKNYWAMIFCWDVVEKSERRPTTTKPQSEHPSALIKAAKELKAKRQEQVRKLREKLNTIFEVCTKKANSGNR